MSYQPVPFAKRNRVTANKPTLDPAAPKEPTFRTPAEPRSSHAPSTSTSISSSSVSAAASSSRPSHRTRNKGSNHWSRSGVPTHGNYSHYYAKRGDGPSSLDPRLALCDDRWFKGKRVLDVGCNSGKVTIEIGQRCQARSVTGVDIDPDLIKRADRALQLAWSRQAPVGRLLDVASEHRIISARTRPASPTSYSPQYFPLALPRMFGFLPTPRDQLIHWVDSLPEPENIDDGADGQPKGKRRKLPPKEIREFPLNVRFRSSDWPVDGVDEDREGYDTIIAFSVTKWIHLHTLNAGLLAFFTRCYNALLPGGRLILEPQPFSSYAPSARLADELRANLDLMKEEGEFRGWKSEEGDFERVLLDQIGFERVDKLGEIGKDGFKRPIEVYVKSGGSWL